ncbi:MAG TPA: hypothetical protein VJN02_10765 [Gammaproteobacteria bacterium]|nr:hypothetical protein [Gammaproteobacteria bacterium]
MAPEKGASLDHGVVCVVHTSVTVVVEQQKLFEQAMQSKIATEQLNQLKDELKILQKETIQMNSIIMKYEDEKKLKDLALAKRKSKNEIANIF